MPASLRRPLLAALVAAVSLAACDKQKGPTLPARGALPDSVDQVMFGVNHLLTTAGVRRARLLADTAFFYDEGRRIELRKVRAIFFTVTGDSDAVMTGQKAIYDVLNQRIDGRGDVVITTVAGRKLTSPHLLYDKALNQVSSDTTFSFSEPGRSMSGIGFRSDPGLHNVQVLKGASGSAKAGPALRNRR